MFLYKQISLLGTIGWSACSGFLKGLNRDSAADYERHITRVIGKASRLRKTSNNVVFPNNG